MTNLRYPAPKNAALAPECSHVEHLWETSYLNSLVQFPCYRTTRLWNAEEGGVQSVECKVWSVKCRV